MKRRRFLWAALIGATFLAAFGVTIGLQQGWAPNPVFRLQVRADLGTWVLIGSIVAAVGLLLAVAGRKLARRLLQRSREQARNEYTSARRRFVRRLDHELKNPLSTIRAQLAYLSQGRASSPEPVLDDMLVQVERMGRLLSHLRKLVELEEQEIEHLPVDVASLLQEVVEASQAHPAYQARRVRLLLPQAPWPLPAVNGDRDLLWQAFFNLVDNALKFTSSDDVVEIRVFEDEHSVVVEVADTGCGIAPDELPYIFEELYRGTNARGYEGSGVGLALVNTVVKLHGGDIRIRSRPDQGTVVTVRLPAMP